MNDTSYLILVVITVAAAGITGVILGRFWRPWP
jgi:hypothetical protein